MKPATAKAKGRATENAWVAYLRSKGWESAERRRLAGVLDRGDIAGVHNQTIEVKSAAQWSPLQWLRELGEEQFNTGDDVGYVTARPKGKTNPEDWVILMTPEQLMFLLEKAGFGPPK